MPQADPTEGSRGFALIVVLWFLVLIAAIGTYLIANARAEAEIAHNVEAAAGAEALADAGVAQAVFHQTEAVEANRWPVDGSPNRVTLSGGEVTVRLSDESKKINPNRASEDVLAGLFEAVGVPRGAAKRLGAATADWVHPGKNPRPLGAKQKQYEAAGKTYGPPNAPVDSLDELQLVLGMTPEIFAKALPYLTIYTRTAEPDAKGAPYIVQRALFLAKQEKAAPGEEAAVGGGDDSDAGDSDADDNDADDSDDDSGDQSGEAGAADANADGSQPADMDDQPEEQVLAVDVTARSANGGVFVRHAIVRIDAADAKAYAVLDWRRGDLTANASADTGQISD